MLLELCADWLAVGVVVLVVAPLELFSVVAGVVPLGLLFVELFVVEPPLLGDGVLELLVPEAALFVVLPVPGELLVPVPL